MTITKSHILAAAATVGLAFAGPAQAASGTSGNVAWTTDVNSVENAPGLVVPTFGTNFGFGGKTSTANDNTVFTGGGANPSSISSGTRDASSGLMYNMAGTQYSTANAYSATTNATTGFARYTLATPAEFFGVYINESGAASVSFLDAANNNLLTLASLSTILTAVPGQAGLYAGYLNVNSNDLAKISKIEFDYTTPSAFVSLANMGYSKTPFSVTVAGDGTPVPEPAMGGLAALGALGAFVVARRRGSNAPNA